VLPTESLRAEQAPTARSVSLQPASPEEAAPADERVRPVQMAEQTGRAHLVSEAENPGSRAATGIPARCQMAMAA
jgi:hypothetical protein